MAFQQKPPTVYDLMNEGSVKRVQRMFNAFGFQIQIDPLALANKHQTKESIMSQLLKDFETSPRLIKIMPKTKNDITDLEDIREAAKDKDLRDYNFYKFIRCLALNSLREEASSLMFQQEKLKEMQVALHKLIALLMEAEYNQKVLIAEEEQLKTKMDEIEAKLQVSIAGVLNQTHNDSVTKLNDIKSEIQSYDKSLAHYKTRKKELKNELRTASEKRAADIINTNPLFKSLINNRSAQEDLARIVFEYKQDLSRIDRTLYKMEQRAKKSIEEEHTAQARELELNKKLQKLAIQEFELKHQYPEGYPPPAQRYGAKSHLVDPGKMEMINQEVEIIRAELATIKDERKNRNKKQAKRSKRMEELKKEKSTLFNAILSTATDEQLIKVLKSDKAKKSLLDELNIKTDPEDALLKNTQNKVNVQEQKKAKHKEIKQVLSQNDKVHALNQMASSHHHPSQTPDNRHELHEILNTLEDERKQEKQRRKEKKANRKRKAGLG